MSEAHHQLTPMERRCLRECLQESGTTAAIFDRGFRGTKSRNRGYTVLGAPLFSMAKDQETVRKREEVWWRMRTWTKNSVRFSWPDIVGMTSGVGHSTAIASAARYAKRMSLPRA